MEIEELRNRMSILNLGLNRLVGEFEDETGYYPIIEECAIEIGTPLDPDRKMRNFTVKVEL